MSQTQWTHQVCSPTVLPHKPLTIARANTFHLRGESKHASLGSHGSNSTIGREKPLRRKCTSQTLTFVKKPPMRCLSAQPFNPNLCPWSKHWETSFFNCAAGTHVGVCLNIQQLEYLHSRSYPEYRKKQNKTLKTTIRERERAQLSVSQPWLAILDEEQCCLGHISFMLQHDWECS